MSVCLNERDRCRLCFTLISSDRSILFSSSCSTKSSNLYQRIQRKHFPRKSISHGQSNVNSRTVCFYHLIRRYLRTDLTSIHGQTSKYICFDCSMNLLDIEQCAKSLRKNIQQLKMKLNKSNQLFTSSLAVKYQKKKSSTPIEKSHATENQSIPMNNSDGDDEEDDEEDFEDDEEEFDDEHEDQRTTDPSKSVSSGADNSLLNKSNASKTTYPCNDDDDDDEDEDDDEDDEEDEDGLVKTPRSSTGNNRSNTNDAHQTPSLLTNHHPMDPNANLLEESNPAMLQLRLVHMMANIAALSNPNGPNHSNNISSNMAAFTHMQRDFFLKMISNPMVAAQVVQGSVAPSSNKSNISSNTKQSGSGRKRKSPPEKRVLTNHPTVNNNGHTSPHDEYELNRNSMDHPIELTVKSGQRSNDVQNLVMNTRGDNGNSSLTIEQMYHANVPTDEDLKESSTLNDSSVSSLSSSVARRSTPSKRVRLSPNHLSMVNPPTSMISDQYSTSNFSNSDDPNAARQQRKLDPLSCNECGKVLFSDKIHLLHCQTHAKNEKQCWICGFQDDDIKKHILSEHGNQKFTNAGFKCQHCDKVFSLFTDLETHMREHSKKKPFECSICHKRFGQQGNLSCHLRIHSGVKPFTCASCGKAFRHSNSLRRHARTVHSATRGLSSSSNSLLLADTSMSLLNDMKQETFDDGPSALMIPSDENSSSTGGVPSPSISNLPMDSDSTEPLGIH